MTIENKTSPEEIILSIKEKFTNNIMDARIEKRTHGIKKTEFIHIWIKMNPALIKDMVQHLFTFDSNLHFAVSSGYDLGDTIELVYHFSIYHGTRHNELSINITMPLPKNNPTIDTITDLIPGALIAEQEKQEMLGVTIKGIPNNNRVFISDDFPKDTFPWRRDNKNADTMAQNLHRVKP